MTVDLYFKYEQERDLSVIKEDPTKSCYLFYLAC